MKYARANYIQSIKGIHITPREQDVLACLLNIRGTKKIANILGIAPSTAVTHVNNIIAKFNCNSREGVMDLLESSDEYRLVKDHYSFLLLELKFKALLKGLVPGSFEKVYLDLHYCSSKDLEIVKRLEPYCALVNIKLTKTKNGADKTICPVSLAQMTEFKATHVDKSTLLISMQGTNGALKDIKGFVVEVENCQSFYHLIFEVLKFISPVLDLKKAMGEFTAYYENMATDGQVQPPRKPKFAYLPHAIGVMVILLGLGMFAISKIERPLNEAHYIHILSSWQMPAQIDNYVARPLLSERVWKILMPENSRMVALYGLGGAGKTTLATNLIHNPKSSFKFKAWFRAQTRELLKAQYFALGERLDLFSPEMPDDLKLTFVKEWLEKQKQILLVFDDAPDLKVLEEFIPHGAKIIVTSRNSNWPQKIGVDVMDEEEALHLLRSLTSSKENDPTSEKQLIQKMGLLPLAIAQTGAYIHTNKISVTKYLSLYETNKAQLLGDKLLPAGSRHEPVYTTWEISVEKIKSHPQGAEVIKLLDFIAHCDATDIPKKLLMQYMFNSTDNQAEIDLYRLLNVLTDFSLIKISEKYVSMHVLVQEYLASKHSYKQVNEIIKKAIDALCEIYVFKNKKWQDIGEAAHLLPHAERIFSQAKLEGDKTRYFDLALLLGDIHKTLGNFEDSKRYLKQAMESSETLQGKDRVKIADALFLLGRVLNRLSDYPNSIKAFQEALKINDNMFGVDSVEALPILNKLGLVYLFSDDKQSAESTLNRALKIAEKRYGTNHVEYANTLHLLGRLEISKGNFEKAIKLLEQSVKIMEASNQANQQDLMDVLHILGWAYDGKGQFEKAKVVLKKNLAIRGGIWGKDHLETAEAEAALSLPFVFLGDYKAAKAPLENSLAIFQKYYGGEHALTIWVQRTLGVVYIASGEYEKAISILNKLLDFSIRTSGENHPRTAKIMGTLGLAKCFSGDCKEGLKLLEKSYNILETAYGKNNINTAIALGNIGLAYGQLAQNSKKHAALSEAIRVFEAEWGRDNRYTQQTQIEIKNSLRDDLKWSMTNQFFYPPIL